LFSKGGNGTVQSSQTRRIEAKLHIISFMKTKLRHFIMLLALLAGIQRAAAQGSTAFTYQGQLRDGGTNANGAYTMIFALYDSVSGGNQIGAAITTSPTLANGLFTVNLDFGAGAFNGGARWLDITITNGGTTQELSPRVQVLPTPYAQFAAVAASVTNGAIMNSQLATNAIATTNIQNGAITAALIANGAVTNQNLAANAVDATNIASGQVVKSLNGLSDFVSLLAGTNMVLATNGNVLQLSTGSNAVTAVDGNLKVVRGIINSDGSIMYGSGFSVSNSPPGSGGEYLDGNYSLNNGDNAFLVNQNQRFPSYVNYFFIDGSFYQYEGESYEGTNAYGVNFYYENFMPSYSGPSGPVSVEIFPQLYPVYTITFNTPFSSPPTVIAGSGASDGDGYDGDDGLHGFNPQSYYVNVGRTSITNALSQFEAVIIRPDILTYDSDSEEEFDFIAIGPQ
jgi:hypothetical protein